MSPVPSTASDKRIGLHRFPGLPSELRAYSDNSGPEEYVWKSKTDGKWDVPIPPTVTPWKEDRMKATPVKLRTGGEARL